MNNTPPHNAPPSPPRTPAHIAAHDLALEIVRALQAARHTAYFAGGCVRDYLMNRPPADYDVATSAPPAEVLKLFPRGRMVGAAFGVVLVQKKKNSVEVATFRSDGRYLDGRHPEAVTFTTPEVDAQRRDFTCNGLFYDPVADKLHDFVAGKKDIEARILRAIGDPRQRFEEDHLRLLRAVRFGAKLGFTIERATWQAIIHLAENIKTISRERVGEEMRSILENPTRKLAAETLERSGLLNHIWPPELLPKSPLTWSRLAALSDPVDRVLGLCAMQLDMTGPPPLSPRVIAEALRNQFTLSNQETDNLAWLFNKLPLLQNWRDQRMATLKRLLADSRWSSLEKIHQSGVTDPAELSALQSRLAELRRDPIGPDPYVTGDDLIKLGAPPGHAFKQWLEQLYDRQLENEFPDRPAALAAAQKLVTG